MKTKNKQPKQKEKKEDKKEDKKKEPYSSAFFKNIEAVQMTGGLEMRLNMLAHNMWCCTIS